jgi:hypothetical protein
MWRTVATGDVIATAAAGRRHRLERGQNLLGALRAVRGILLEARHDERGERGRQRRPMIRDGHHRLGHVRGQHLVRREPRERRAAGNHFVRHRAERVDVGAVVDIRITRGLLRGHIRGRPERHADGGESTFGFGLADRLRDAEIGDDGVMAREQHVVGLDVAMDHAARVRVGQRVGDVLEDPDRVAHRKLAFARQAGPERLALHERHRNRGCRSPPPAASSGTMCGCCSDADS